MKKDTLINLMGWGGAFLAAASFANGAAGAYGICMSSPNSLPDISYDDAFASLQSLGPALDHLSWGWIGTGVANLISYLAISARESIERESDGSLGSKLNSSSIPQ